MAMRQIFNVLKVPLANQGLISYSIRCGGACNFGGSQNVFNRRFQFQYLQRSFSTCQLKFAKAQSKEAEDKKDDSNMEILAKMEEIQIRQKRMLEEPDETEPHQIYTGLLTNQIRRLKFFSFMTSAIGLGLQPLMLEQAGEMPKIAMIGMVGMMSFFIVGTPLLIQVVAKKYVTDMIYDPNSDIYTATTYSFFMRKRQVSFKIDDVIVPEVPGPFTSFTVKTKDGKVIPYFVAPESFIKVSHFGRLMGYDKPINLHLNVKDGSRNK